MEYLFQCVCVCGVWDGVWGWGIEKWERYRSGWRSGGTVGNINRVGDMDSQKLYLFRENLKLNTLA